MDKLKNLLKSDTPTDETSSTSPTTGTTGRVTGQGSHFPGQDSAALNAGPERGGSEHVNTMSTGNPSTGREASSYTATNADFPTSQSAQDGSGSAAIGQTTTYSSSHLGRGDPVPSVVDSQSNDPLTYKKPESSHVGDSSGVPAGSANTAASKAFASGQERSMEGSSGSDNPYRASSLDPRVDGGARSSVPTATSGTSSYGRDAALGAGVGTGVSAAAAGTSHSHDRSYETSAPAQSTLTTTVDPVDRSAEYGGATTTKGLDNAASNETATGQRGSAVGKALGAVGLGGLAGSLGYGSAESHKGDSSAITDTPSQPTTTTGVDSYTAPTQQGQTSTHYRRESIPTTAYPAGIDSPRAINAPVGGTRTSVDSGAHQSSGHTGAVAGGAALAGATAVGASQYEQSKSLRENVTGASSGTVSQGTGLSSHATSGVPGEMYGESRSLRDNTISGPTSTHASTGHTSAQPTSSSFLGGTTVHDAITVGGTGSPSVAPGSYGTEQSGKFTATPLTDRTRETGHTSTIASPQTGGDKTYTIGHSGDVGSTQLGGESTRGVGQTGKFTSTPLKEEDHTGRNVALGAGAGAAAVGAGAYGVSEHSQRDAEKAEAEAAKERAAHQKELEKQHKAAEKEAAKEEKHHQKELEKEQKAAEKKHEKELAAVEKKHEKEEHKHQKELEKEEHKRQKELEHEEEERRKKAMAATAGAGAGTGALAAEEEKERKPSFFRRIFKKRQNKNTGEEEEYSTDEEDSTHHKGALAGAGVVGAGTAAGATAAHERTTGHPTTTSSYEQQSGGLQKPSYNPLSHDDPSKRSATGVDSSATGTHTGPATTGLPGTGASTSTSAPIEPITGLPYDPSKDPKTAANLASHQHGAGMGQTGTTSTTGFDPIAAGSFKMGEIVDSKHPHGSESAATGTGYNQGTAATSTGTGYGHESGAATTGTAATTTAGSGYGHGSETTTTQGTHGHEGEGAGSFLKALPESYGHGRAGEEPNADAVAAAPEKPLQDSFKMGGL